jgi:flagellar hook-basal body complex protein FliE
MALLVAPAQVAAAYRATSAPAVGAAVSVVPGSGFGATLQRAVEGAVEVGRSADAATTQALLGQGSVADVVMAVSRAELTLQTAVAVRDRVVSAYQDVMRMPI